MSSGSELSFPWSELAIAPTRDDAEIKRAYARRLKTIDAATDPAAFQALRRAYEGALALIKPQREASPEPRETGETTPDLAETRDTAPQLDALIADVERLALADNVTEAMAAIERFLGDRVLSPNYSAHLQARLLCLVMDDPRMPTAMLGALAHRFRWGEVGNALEQYHPDLQQRFHYRLTAAHEWLQEVKAAAQRMNRDGVIARFLLLPYRGEDDRALLGDFNAADVAGFLNGARRFGPLVGDVIDPRRVAFLEDIYKGEIRVPRKEDPPKPANKSTAKKPIKPTVNPTVTGTSALPPSAQWGLALAAVYTRVNGTSDRALEPWSNIKDSFSAKMLKDWWGIDGDTPAKRRNQAIDVLNWLANEGHRMSPRYVEPGDREAPKDLLAWDIARLVNIARHAFMSGYITEEEGWAYVRDAAKMAQPNFSSWEDYANRNSRGRYRWRAGADKTFDDAVEFLLKNGKSPWRTLDWHMPLRDEDFRNPVKIATKTTTEDVRNSTKASSRQAKFFPAWIAIPIALAIVAHVLRTVEINTNSFWPSSSRSQHHEPIPFPSKLSSPLDETPLDKFSKFDVMFYPAGGYLMAQLRNTPVLNDKNFVAFRYGIDAANPDKSPVRKSEYDKTVPDDLELPRNTRFLTIQVKFQDGTMSPIRRFDVPANARQQQ